MSRNSEMSFPVTKCFVHILEAEKKKINNNNLLRRYYNLEGSNANFPAFLFNFNTLFILPFHLLTRDSSPFFFFFSSPRGAYSAALFIGLNIRASHFFNFVFHYRFFLYSRFRPSLRSRCLTPYLTPRHYRPYFLVFSSLHHSLVRARTKNGNFATALDIVKAWKR